MSPDHESHLGEQVLAEHVISNFVDAWRLGRLEFRSTRRRSRSPSGGTANSLWGRAARKIRQERLAGAIDRGLRDLLEPGVGLAVGHAIALRDMASLAIGALGRPSGMFPHPSHTPVMIPLTAAEPWPPPFARTATLNARPPKKRPSRTPSVPNVAAKLVATGAKLL